MEIDVHDISRLTILVACCIPIKVYTLPRAPTTSSGAAAVICIAYKLPESLSAPGHLLKLSTVILPFMVIVQRHQPESIERHTNIYLCTPISARETKLYRLAGRNYRDTKSDEELNARHRRIFRAG
jgi:hypothetical protein